MWLCIRQKLVIKRKNDIKAIEHTVNLLINPVNINPYLSSSLSTKIDGLEYSAMGRSWAKMGTSAGFSRTISSS